MINKIFRIVFCDVFHPEGRERAKPIFWYFSKFCLHGTGVAYGLERLFKNFSDIFGQPESRVENVCIIPNLASNKV